MLLFLNSSELIQKVLKIASGNVVALAMTAEERHCESAMADVAVSSYITHERNKFLRSEAKQSRY